MPPPLRFVLCVAGLCLAKLAVADENIDFDREQPVPASSPIPIQDFFRQGKLGQPKLNHAGTQIAALASGKADKQVLIVFDLNTKKVEYVQGFGDKDIYHFDWLDDTHLMYGLSTEKLYGLAWMVGEVGSLDRSYPVFQYCGTRLVSIPRRDPLHPLVWQRHVFTENGRVQDGGVVSVNATTTSHTGVIDLDGDSMATRSELMQIMENNDRHTGDSYPEPKEGIKVGYLADKEGELAFAFTAQDGQTSLHRLENKKWVKCPVDLDKIEVMGAGEKDGEVVVTTEGAPGTPRPLHLLDTKTGAVGELLMQDKAYDFEGWLYRSPMDSKILGAVYDRDTPAVAWFDNSYRILQKQLDGFFPGVLVRILGSDEKNERLLVRTFSDRQPSIYYSVDLKTKSIGLIKNTAPWIDPKRMRPMNIIKFKTRDGHQLDAYLTLPEGASKATPAPLVVLPHGGPFVRDTWSYDSEVQFLASRGYAVLQPNYRGSTGYGWRFSLAEQWDFRKMSDDVTDATKAALKSGFCDPARIAIMGASFGGYLAISGIVHEPDLYRCAVTEVGVFDWYEMIKDAKENRYENPRYGALLRWLGDPKKDKDKFEAMSPINFISQAKVPIFVAAGKEDPNVAVHQSTKLISELKKYHIPYEKFIAPGEGHGMMRLENRVKMYARIEAFLESNLKQAAPVPAATQP